MRTPGRSLHPAFRSMLLLLLTMAVQAAVLVTGPESAAGATLRIMPLGDSITHGLPPTHACGCGVPGAYRINLDARLRAAGLPFDFVGSQSNGPQIDKNHEGRPGYRIDEIHNGRPGMNTGINGWLVNRPADAVLLLIGTNDVLQNRDLPNAPSRLSALVDRIMALRPDATVYVASIPPLVGPKAALNSKVISYNSAVRQIVLDKAAAGRPVRFVDVYPALGAGDLAADGIHPTRAGHDKIAKVWGDALLAAAPSPTDTTAPIVTGMVPVPTATGVASSATVTATFNEALDPNTVNETTFSLRTDAGPVTSAVSYNASTRTATLRPSSALSASTAYTATLEGGLGGISDLAGNELTADATWTFTTAAPSPLPGDGWTNVGTGALVATTSASLAVSYPAGVAAGDLLLLGCQGRNNAMDWSAAGFSTLQAPVGPAGLRFELLSSWAAGTESGSVTIANASPTNGWSCSITAMRGGPGSGDEPALSVVAQIGSNRLMTAPGMASIPAGALVMRWFASSDDNAHGGQSEGTLAFGGISYGTETGVDHASSMSYLVQDTAGARGAATMTQNANFADPFVGVSVALQ